MLAVADGMYDQSATESIIYQAEDVQLEGGACCKM